MEATIRGSAARRHVEDREQLLVPLRADDVEKLGARGVPRFDHRLAAEARQEEGVDRADADFTRFGARLAARQPIQKPAGLGGGEHRVERQAALAADRAPVAGGAQGRAGLLGALVLPGQNRRQRLARSAVPDDAGLALSAEANRRHAPRRPAVQRFACRAPDAAPDLIAVLLHPARLRRRERHRRLSSADDLPAAVDQQRLGRACALIDGEEERARHVTAS